MNAGAKRDPLLRGFGASVRNSADCNGDDNAQSGVPSWS